ncbi:unnamed protein product [Agarophyton chilense]
MQSYHRDAMKRVRQCDRLFLDALSVRARYVRMSEYVDSVDFRVLKQEVVRLSFENDDFARHMRFWRRHNQTLHLVVATSPEAIKHARDALYSEMRAYETDALLIGALRNGSYTKEKQARFTIRLRGKVRKQLAALRKRNAMVQREALFINHARAELYTLLHSVWHRLVSHRTNLTCGPNVLSDAVTLTFKSDLHSQ